MNVRHIIQKSILAAVTLLTMAGCSLMTDDLSDCPTGLYVNFVYDYNIQRADMFKDHVGSVSLYVYDESDRLVVQRSVSGSQLAVYGFTIHFTEDELAPDHQYRLVAVGMQKDWQEALGTPGAKYRYVAPQKGDSWKQLTVTLDHKPSADMPAHYSPVDNSAPLDTLWRTLCTIENPVALQPAATRYHELADGSVSTNGVERIELVKGEPAYATVSLIRDTKHLNISLREIDHPERTSHEDYEVFIIDNNSTLDYQNRLINTEDTLVYRPYAQWTTTYVINGAAQNGEEAEEQRSAHYDLMFNRLMYSTTPKDCAVLCIRRKSDGKDIALLNLPEVLAEGRTAYEINNYRPQEYLDREYDYRLELFLKGEEWQQLAYLNICIDVLSWAKRIQYVNF